MSGSPMFDAWMHYQRERYERNLPRATHWYLHPKDSHDLEAEIYTYASLRGIVHSGRPGSLMLQDVEVRVEQGVVEGWWLVEAQHGRPTMIYAMRQFRCLVHEDCLKNYGLGIACLASEKRSTDHG